jgi:Tol biopolymer transport system component/predicted Ser/Thr protein kinase
LLDNVSLSAGEMLGPYEILGAIGAGGMGEVYKARDTRLDRMVAIKVSQEKFSERFGNEAHAVAALNHPYICQLYDVGSNYLVMEFVEGTPLKGPLAVEKAVECAGQILDALDAAHRKGITHRDLKPANILVTKQGIKLLDFGLAKQSASLKESDDTRALTQQGHITGTLQYMSPEQLHGKEADVRSDLFSFGCVLYEMLTGKRAFDGQSAASVIAAILEREPAQLDLAPPLERIVKTCLAKDPDQRFQTALDLKRNLTWALDQPGTAKANRRAWIAVAAPALALGAFGGWAVSQFRQPPPDDRVIRFQIAPPEGGYFSGGFALSPDGNNVAFAASISGKTGLWVRKLDATKAQLIPGSEGATGPIWSPDSGSVAFFSRHSSMRLVLQRFDLPQQATSKICDVPGAFAGSGSWSRDGRILFTVRDVGIFQAPASGGAPSQVTTLDHARGENNHALPQALPRGRFLYSVLSSDPRNAGAYAASLERPAERVRLLPSYALYAPGADGDDYLLWVRGQTLVAQQFNAVKLRLIGEPQPVAEPVITASSGGRTLLYGPFSPRRQFKWVDRSGKEAGLLGEPGPWVFSRFSPDGGRVATIRGGDTAEVWLLETRRGVATPLTSGPGIHIDPVWSPDGKTILFSAGSPFNLFRIPSDGAGAEERVLAAPTHQVVNDWSPDGRFVMYSEETPDTARDLWVLPVTPEGRPSPGAKPWPFVRDRLDQTMARFSPDTRWVAYQSDESGQTEVYVRSFPEPREKLQISTSGGTNPAWGPGGHELFYISRDRKLMVVTLKLAGTALEASLPRELFALPPPGTAGSVYEPAPDGQRFLVSDVAPSSEPLTVIVNWQALLKKGSAAP